MTKTTRNQRRKRKLSSPAAAGHDGAKAKSKKLASSASGKPTTTVSAGGIAVRGGRAIKRPTPRVQAKATKKVSASGKNGADGGKKRPRSEVQPEEEEEKQEEEGRPQIVDELVATIQHHDEFFSRMLDMIPEHLVLPAKEAAESSYASKYMKVRYCCEIVRVSGATGPCLEGSGSVMLASVEGYFALTLFCDGVPRPLTGEPLTASRRCALSILVLAAFPAWIATTVLCGSFYHSINLVIATCRMLSATPS